MARDLGIGKDGPSRIRKMAIELAWNWLYWQPESALSRWFQSRYGTGTKRERRKGIVALARKLLIALWRWVDQATLPEGAILTD